MIGLTRCIAGVPTSAASPSESDRGARGGRERAELLDEAVDVRRRASRSASTGVISSESPPEAHERRAQLAQEPRQQPEVALEVGAPLGGRLATVVGACR